MCVSLSSSSLLLSHLAVLCSPDGTLTHPHARRIRKLILVGLLVLAGRGSVAQLFVAVVVSVTLLALQLVLQPYKHTEVSSARSPQP